MDKNSSTTKEGVAHSTIRRHLSDYTDGANVTNRLGNDDQNENFGTFYSGPPEDEDFGQIAYGNEDFFEESESENDI